MVRLAQLTGHDKSQVSRTLRILAEAGLVDRVPTSQAYRLGWRLYGLAAVAGDARLREEAPPLLVDLVGRVGERAHVSVLEAGAVLTLWSEAPPSAIQAAGWVGRSVPAHCSSSGRALLMDHDPAALVSLFGEGALEPSGPNGPRHVDDLAARVAAAARVGYAVVDEEFEVGLVAVAAPVRDFRGTIVAAINVSGPKFRLRPHLDRAAEATLAAARRLTALLGGEPALEASRYEPDQREANP
ncbi:MAG: IclR family transcriptional regulator [Acidimicrobiales bacterium]